MQHLSPSSEFWRSKRVLVTGHTGFKGSWLALWLSEMGADVYGLALEPEHARGVYNVTQLSNRVVSHIGDIRDQTQVDRALKDCQPDVVFHFAAQALVRRAHADPHETYSTNVLGLATILESVKTEGTARAVVVATSDKVYENRDEGRAFQETDRLGGFEPYGVSKAAGELIVDGFRHCLPTDSQLGVATVRAGNVVGGGDWAEDRLIPDAMAAFASGISLEVRSPRSTRPWQHVFDPLAGYMLLAEKLFSGAPEWRSAWNFGPASGSSATACTVGEIADHLVTIWNTKGASPQATWSDMSNAYEPYEAKLLAVDSSKAQGALEWKPRIQLEQALETTVSWYLADLAGEDMFDHALQSLQTFYPIN